MIHRSTVFKTLGAAVVAAGALFAASSASAQVNWSIGIAAPGISVGVNRPYYPPAPVYYPPAPVYYQPPAPVYYQPPPPVYYRPSPVYYAPPQPFYGPRPYGPGYGHRHDNGWR